MTKLSRNSAAAVVPVALGFILCAAQPSWARGADYTLRYGDAIGVTVLAHPELSIASQPIRPDGMVALPFVSDVPAAGKTIPELTAKLTQAFRPYVQKPHVMVSLTKIKPLKVTVLGQVARPGTFDFEEEPDLADALATAGGLTRRAAHDQIKVAGPGRSPKVYDIDALLNGGGKLPTIDDNTVIDAGEVWYPDGYALLPAFASVLASAVIVYRGWPF